MSKKYGYVRVSTINQKEDRQIHPLAKLGIEKRNVFIDKSSGMNFKRTEYNRLKKTLKKGDVIIIGSVDRLGRNYNDILQQWNEITKNIKANIKVLDMPLLDTTVEGKSLIDIFLRDVVLHILSFTAEQEWHNIKKRQAEGIKIAKEKGRHIGRPQKECPKYFDKIFIDWINGNISAKTAMEKLNIKKTTFYKLAKSFKTGGRYGIQFKTD